MAQIRLRVDTIQAAGPFTTVITAEEHIDCPSIILPSTSKLLVGLDLFNCVNRASQRKALMHHLTFRNMNDFTPEQVARQIPRLKAMLAMRSLLRDLKANLLDNVTFRKELEKILRDPALSQALRDELRALVPEKA